ncbi:hypothetical protein ACHAXH_009725 [Discostella pseudostelligera]
MTMNLLLPSARILSNAPAPSRLLCRRTVTTNVRLFSPAAATAKQPTESAGPTFSRHRCHGASRTTTTIIQPALRSIHTTPLPYAQITINVPTMGDSITEGTIVEWCVPPGSQVREGDVLALVETDKVTVDIKADRDGILVKQLGEVEGVVEVGQGLYILDTDVSSVGVEAGGSNLVDVAAVNAMLDADKMVAETPSSSSPTLPSLPSPSLSLASGGGRVPSIHFLGKEGWRERLSPSSLHDATPTTTQITSTLNTNNNPKSPTSITYIPYSPMYGRPPIMEDEMEALILGGAEEAPEVKASDKGGWRGVTFVGGKVVTAGPRGVWLAE